MIENNNFEAENLQQQIQQSDYPSIDNFLKNGFSNDTKIIIDNIFNDDPELKDSFESFLKTAALKDKMLCKKHLLDAETQDEIRSIIMENIPGGCRMNEIISNVSFDDIAKDIEMSIEDEQLTIIREQNNIDNFSIIKPLLDDAYNKYSILVQNNPELESIAQEGSQKFIDVESELEDDGVIDQLKDFGFDDDAVKQYVSFVVTYEEINSNPEYQALRESQDFSLFYIAMKTLNNACNIPDTSFDSFSEKNIVNTRAELFHETIGNNGLIEQRQRNIESHSTDYERLFSVESDDELIQKYGKFLDDDGKTLFEQWEHDSSSISSDDLDMLMNSIKSKQEEIESKTQNVIEELCMTSQIKGFLNCIPSEFSESFQFNKANEISINQDGILQLDGHVNGINFSLKQDTNDVNARLQTSTMLYRDQDHNLDFAGKYKNSPFILPTSSEVFNTAIGAMDMDELAKIENQDDYFDVLQNSILKSMDELYSNTQYTHHYVESQIRSEKTVYETMGIFKKIGGGNIETLSTVGNSKIYDFFDTLEFNLSVMTNKEKKQFEECLRVLGAKISEGGNIAGSNGFVKDENLAKLLGSKKKTQKQIDGLSGRNKDNSFFDFFGFFFSPDERSESGNRQVLNLNKLSKCLKDEAYARDLWEDSERYRSKLDSQFDIGFEG